MRLIFKAIVNRRVVEIWDSSKMSGNIEILYLRLHNMYYKKLSKKLKKLFKITSF